MPSHDNGQASDLPLPLEPATNSRIPASDAPTPLGTLSVLPRELRDEIYRLLSGPKWYFSGNHPCCTNQPCCTSYRTRCKDCHPNCWSKWGLGKFNVNTELPMKALSRSIRQEFLAMFHTEAIFTVEDNRYRCRELWLSENKSCTRDEIPFIDQIQNVEIEAVLYAEGDRYCAAKGIDIHRENGYLSTRGSEPISFFTSKSVSRKTCVVILECSTPKAILILQSPFFNAVRQLTGFNTMTLKVKSSRFYQWSPEDTLAYLGLDVPGSCRTEGLPTMVNSMKSALEPSLGPSIISEDFECPWFDTWKVTFHPRDFVSKG